VRIEAVGLAGGTARISGATSSQFLSGLLMTAPLARAPVAVEITDTLVSQPYVAMTLALMQRYGIQVRSSGALRYEVPAPQRYRSPGRVLVEGDASSASYFLAGAAISGGTVRVEGLAQTACRVTRGSPRCWSARARGRASSPPRSRSRAGQP
jgi:3-phosphoshikimate 1-carboxyvinyltransferase